MIVLVMGVTGAGKTTVGRLLAQTLGWPFLDADDFHPATNIEKMRSGVPLNDSDRLPWLAAIHTELLRCAANDQDVVLACSALKRSYREMLGDGLDVRICYLKASYSEIEGRLRSRSGHFAGKAILAGQFADLEEPTDAIVIAVTESAESTVREALERLHLP
jgi:gluconokinase